MLYAACFGDSLIEGFPYGKRASWCAAAEEFTAGDGKRALKLLNYGLCGDCTDDILDRLRQYRPTLPPYVGHIIFLGGANDIIQGVPRTATAAAAARAAAFCEEEGLRLGVVLPFISGEEELNRYLYPLREALAAELCPPFAFSICSRLWEKILSVCAKPTSTGSIPLAPLMRPWGVTPLLFCKNGWKKKLEVLCPELKARGPRFVKKIFLCYNVPREELRLRSKTKTFSKSFA